jgi:hypothetical protein
VGNGLGSEDRIVILPCLRMMLLKYHILVALIIMLLLLMMQLEKLGFIAFEKKNDVFDTFKKWKALVDKGIVNGETSTSTYILTGYGLTPPSFSLTPGRKHSREDIKLIEELPLGFLERAVTIALPLGLLAGVVAETLILLLSHL